eukprot:Phypoly_transcript_15697.p1 GENE.Phypoly_transcript_15697~~Phypoly_transcript_15697.p1  ORF type:complete len:192 (+),score=23.55 Phypoly_transcript_15697:49-624(+)
MTKVPSDVELTIIPSNDEKHEGEAHEIQEITEEGGNHSHEISQHETDAEGYDEHELDEHSHLRGLKRIHLPRTQLSNKSVEGTVNERTLLSWNRSFFGVVFITFTLIKLFSPSAYIFAVALYFVLLAALMTGYSTYRYNLSRKLLEEGAYPADRLGPYLIGGSFFVGYLLLLVAVITNVSGNIDLFGAGMD